MKLHAPMRRTTVVTITAAASLVEGGMAGLILQDIKLFSPAVVDTVLSGLMRTIPNLTIGVVPEPSVNGVAEETNKLGGGIFGGRVTGEEGQELHIAWLYRC